MAKHTVAQSRHRAFISTPHNARSRRSFSGWHHYYVILTRAYEVAEGAWSPLPPGGAVYLAAGDALARIARAVGWTVGGNTAVPEYDHPEDGYVLLSNTNADLLRSVDILAKHYPLGNLELEYLQTVPWIWDIEYFALVTQQIPYDENDGPNYTLPNWSTGTAAEHEAYLNRVGDFQNARLGGGSGRGVIVVVMAAADVVQQSTPGWDGFVQWVHGWIASYNAAAIPNYWFVPVQEASWPGNVTVRNDLVHAANNLWMSHLARVMETEGYRPEDGPP